jgi:hypothetical protein
MVFNGYDQTPTVIVSPSVRTGGHALVFYKSNGSGKIRFRLWNPHTEQAIGNSKLEIEGHEVLSDKDGLVQLTLPLDQQRPVYKVISSVPLETDSIFMPCGEDDVILTK